MKRTILAAFVAIVLGLTMIACAEIAKPTKLAAPENLTFEDDFLMWDEVENASGYSVKIVGGETYDCGDSTYFGLEELPSGYYAFVVMATGDGENYTDSAWSSSMIVDWHKESGDSEPLKHAAPTGLRFEDGLLLWNAVPNAHYGYAVQILDDEFDAFWNVFEPELEAGDYTARVKTLGDEDEYLDSEWSAWIPFTIF